MSILSRLFGARSKYDRSIPYLYEARKPIEQLDGEFRVYYAETICALLRRLTGEGVAPEEVRLYEVYRDREIELLVEHCVDAGGGWLDKPELCRSLEQHYAGHIHEGCCSFDDRKQQGQGPF